MSFDDSFVGIRWGMVEQCLGRAARLLQAELREFLVSIAAQTPLG